MKELLDKILFYVKGMWLKRRYIVIAAWILCPIGWFYTMQLPDQYRASARVYVDTDSLLRPLLRGLTVETFKDKQLNLMVKTLLSRPNLEKIARMSDLDIHTNNSKEFDALIDSLGKSIKIASTRREKIFTISYENQSKEAAIQVVKSVLTIFVEDTLGENRTDTDNAQRFLNQQIKDFEQRMKVDDAALTEFKRKNADLLPGEGSSYYGLLKQEQLILEQTELQLKEAETRLASARLQLEDEQTIPYYSTPDGNNFNPSISTQYDNRIEAMQQSLDELSLRYTDRHPDIIELKKQLANLRKKQAQERSELIALSQQQKQPATEDESPFVQSLRVNVSELESEVASLKVRRQNFQDKVDKLQQKVHLVPQIEAELAALTRGYGITKSQYNQLLERREAAIMSQKAGQSVDGVEFKIIEPPRVPREPVGPHRVIYLTVVTIVGLGVGLFVAFALSQLNPIVTGSRELSSITNLPVLGSISHANANQVIKTRRKHNMAFSAIIAALLITYAGLIVSQSSQLPLMQKMKNLVAMNSSESL